MIYQLKGDADGSVIVYLHGNQVIKLEGGNSPVIVMTYQNMSQYKHRGDDYMAGVIAGIMHCHLICPPGTFSHLPEVPPLDTQEPRDDAP